MTHGKGKLAKVVQIESTESTMENILPMDIKI
jgi:hypothetical protein